MFSLKPFLKQEIDSDLRYDLAEFLTEYRKISKQVKVQKITVEDFENCSLIQFSNLISHYGFIGVYNYNKKHILIYTKFVGYTLFNCLKDIKYLGFSEEYDYELFKLEVNSEIGQYLINKFKLCILNGKANITKEELQTSIQNFD